MKNLMLSASKTVVNPWYKDLFKDLTKTFRVHAVFISLIVLYMFALIVIASLLKVIHKISFSLYPEIIQLAFLSVMPFM